MFNFILNIFEYLHNVMFMYVVCTNKSVVFSKANWTGMSWF